MQVELSDVVINLQYFDPLNFIVGFVVIDTIDNQK